LFELLSALTVGHEAVITNPLKTVGENVEQKAPDELAGIV
jgi:hypothetical protein